MALTVCRTTYSGVLRDNMDFSTALTDGDGRLIAQGPHPAGPSRLGADGHRIGAAPLRRRHPPRRHLRDERPVRRRHAPARHLHLQAGVRGRRPPGLRRHRLPPRRCRRARGGLQRLRFHRDLPGGRAHPAAPPVRQGPAQRDPLRAAGEERALARSSSSATSAPSLPPATSQSASSSSWSSSTAPRPRASTCARSSTMPSASPAPRCASSPTARPASRTGSTTTASIAASPSGCSSRSARRAAACTPTGRAPRRR